MSTRSNGHVHPEETGLVTLGAVSMHCSHNVASNLKKYREFIEAAVDRNVSFLVFPEVSLHGYFWTTGQAN